MHDSFTINLPRTSNLSAAILHRFSSCPGSLSSNVFPRAQSRLEQSRLSELNIPANEYAEKQNNDYLEVKIAGRNCPVTDH